MTQLTSDRKIIETIQPKHSEKGYMIFCVTSQKNYNYTEAATSYGPALRRSFSSSRQAPYLHILF